MRLRRSGRMATAGDHTLSSSQAAPRRPARSAVRSRPPLPTRAPAGRRHCARGQRPGGLRRGPGAAAKNGDTVRAGDRTTATQPTTIESTKGPALQARISGRDGVAVRGSASSPKGIGVQGEATSDKGDSVGVQGLSQSPDGIAGQFIAEGGGTAVEATSEKEGVALRTKGRLELTERSGIASVSGGAEFVIPVAGGSRETSTRAGDAAGPLPGRARRGGQRARRSMRGSSSCASTRRCPEPARVGWLVLD